MLSTDTLAIVPPTFMNHLSTLENLNEQKASYFISGDINIDLLQSDNDLNLRSYSDMLFSLECLPLIKYFTRVTPASATLIDHIYSNDTLHPTTTHVLLEDISDHMSVLVLLKNNKHKNNNQSKTLILETQKTSFPKYS